MIVFWLIFSLFVIKTSFPLLQSLYCISKADKSYYSIKVVNDLAEYTRVTEPPANWVLLSQISKRLQGAIISSEDGTFYDHPGYDLEQLRGAIFDSFVLKKKMRGASTITQQLVKNLFLSRDKTFGRKAKELIMALMLEKHADKQKILETYLNIIEYGKGLYGIKQAAHYYFNKAPALLTARESAFLAMLLPSPKKYSKSFKMRTLTSFAKRSIDSILLKMRQGGYISEVEYQEQLVSHFSWEKVILEPSPLNNSQSEEDLGEEEFIEGNE
ncbi:MAG: transglycosylase domain-containing protein [Bacteriovorax sp.]